MTPSSPTLQDVAEMAKVSTATVSRCLNFPDKVNADTRERVLEAVKTLGYAPNFGARAMAAKRTYTIGAIVPTLENAIFALGLQAFQEELHAHGYTLLVASSGFDPAVEEQQIHALVARGAEGILLIGHDRPTQTHRYLKKRQIPVIAAWSHFDGSAVPSVGFDNYRAMSSLMDEVISLGHREVAILTAPVEGNDRARARVQSICDALRSIEAPAPKIIECSYDIDEGYKAAEKALSPPNRPSILICINDVLAAGAMTYARDAGIVVPDQLSITGFDDLDLARVLSPALTTVRVPHRDMGRAAAKSLVQLIEGGGTVSSVKLETKLKLRQSLARPPITGS